MTNSIIFHPLKAHSTGYPISFNTVIEIAIHFCHSNFTYRKVNIFLRNSFDTTIRSPMLRKGLSRKASFTYSEDRGLIDGKSKHMLANLTGTLRAAEHAP